MQSVHHQKTPQKKVRAHPQKGTEHPLQTALTRIFGALAHQDIAQRSTDLRPAPPTTQKRWCKRLSKTTV
jgi:hypothetical protein